MASEAQRVPSQSDKEARELRSRMITEELKAIPLTAVMERVFGIAGEKASAGWLKYRMADGTLLSVQTDGPSFGALTERRFASLRNAQGGTNAINLVLAVKEANGQQASFLEARNLLQRTFLPHTIESYSRGNSGPRISVGDVDLSAIYHKDAVITDGKRFHLVVSSWNDSERRSGAVRVVECDHEGLPIPGAQERTHSEVPALFLEQDRKTIGAISVVRSAHPLIPDGMTSTAADLLLVPHGPFKGLMLGQLNEGQLEELKRETQSESLRGAIAATKPLSLKFAQKHRNELETMEERRVLIPDPLPFIRLDGQMVDNTRLTRDYLVKTRGINPELVSEVMKAKLVVPLESVVPVRDRVTKKEIPNRFYHNPAFGIPYFKHGAKEPVGYQMKVLYQDPETAKRRKGHDSVNHGPVRGACTIIGELSDKTREVVTVEAFIDGLSYRQLKNTPPTTAIYVLHGARVPHELIKDCAARDIKLITALDNDHTGRSVSAQIQAECEQAGVRHANEIPGPLSEIKVALRENDFGRARLQELKEFCEWKQILFAERNAERGWMFVAVDNTADSARFVAELKTQDEKARAIEGRTEKHVAVAHLNKDWNDVLCGTYRRSLGVLAEKTKNEARDMEPTEDIAAAREAIGAKILDSTAGMRFQADAKKLFVELTDQFLRRHNRTVDSLTIRELRGLTTEAARQHADRLEERLLEETPSRINTFDPLNLVADLRRLRREFENAKPGERAAIERDTERSVAQIDGPDLTRIPLAVAAKEYVLGRMRDSELTTKAVQHASAIAERVARGLEIGNRGHALTR